MALLKIRQMATEYNLSSRNLLTFTNPKVGKNSKVNVPTAVLHLTPMLYGACPNAGSCKLLCLNKAGNPVYLKGKLACRLRRSKAFNYQPMTFKQFLLLELCRFIWKNPITTVGVRLNGTSDHRWEVEQVEVDSELSNYIAKKFKMNIPAGIYPSIMHAISEATSLVKFYDYTKRIDRNWAAATEIGYDLTLSYGSTADTVSEALNRELNLAAAFYGIKRSQPLPESVVINGREVPVIDGDVTDWRPADPKGRTHIVGLRLKRTPGQTEAQARRFCLA